MSGIIQQLTSGQFGDANAEQGTARNFIARVLGQNPTAVGPTEGGVVEGLARDVAASPAPAPAPSKFAMGTLPVPYIEQLRNSLYVGAGFPQGAPRGTGPQPPKSMNLNDTMPESSVIGIERRDLAPGEDPIEAMKGKRASADISVQPVSFDNIIKDILRQAIEKDMQKHGKGIGEGEVDYKAQENARAQRGDAADLRYFKPNTASSNTPEIDPDVFMKFFKGILDEQANTYGRKI